MTKRFATVEELFADLNAKYVAKKDAALQRALNRFQIASENFAFKGSAHPDDWIEAELAHARKLLERLIERRMA